MKYQCEVCGAIYTEKGRAIECEVSCYRNKCATVGHSWVYGFPDESSITRNCSNPHCEKHDQHDPMPFTQAELADLWARKAKEATT